MAFTRVPGFLPSQSGFHFSNSWPPGTNYPIVNLPVVGPVGGGDAGNGICGGFAFAALDLFCHQPRLAPPPDTALPPVGGPIFNYLVGRLMDSFGTPAQGGSANAARVVEWIYTPSHDVTISFSGAGLGRRVLQQEWPKIKMDIDSGLPSPLNLIGGPWRAPTDIAGIIDTLHHCHQVLAYGYQVDSAGNLTILVYDCNDPQNDNSSITLNINSDPAHTVAMAAVDVNAKLTGGIDLRGFFRSQYQMHDPTLLAVTPWVEIGHANSAVTMAAANNKLFCGTSDNRLWARDPLLSNISWQEIGVANNAVAMTAINYKLFCATKDNRLCVRDAVASNATWQDIGHANNVVGMASINGKLFCATSDNQLWARDPVLSNVNWTAIGHANNVVTMTAINNKLFAVTRDDNLWSRDPVLSNINWQAIGPAMHVVAMAGINNNIFGATTDNRLLTRFPSS
jgi:hypothetical protein